MKELVIDAVMMMTRRRRAHRPFSEGARVLPRVKQARASKRKQGAAICVFISSK